MKKKTLIILGVILILLLSVGVYLVKDSSTFKITINNKTNKEISGLKISYSNNSKNINVPSIKAGKSTELKVKADESGSLVMYYTDILGDSHKEILAGYFQKGFSGKVVVNITTVNDLGIYGMEIASPEAENILNNE
ncbi:hypothetical protein [Clostridium sp. LIBA-8841]|uniref:hypothetical protein n=1 Tax=Clostridium sp. LIBA-8841 TaxID=2987530 RepID=UPI002AC70A40|nr:hypothetical protein [Clostridium sp. LIBA-8841]MDZ5253237.1 hypothetical protein [Clostridium sp. LIBA-8841]